MSLFICIHYQREGKMSDNSVACANKLERILLQRQIAESVDR